MGEGIDDTIEVSHDTLGSKPLNDSRRFFRELESVEKLLKVIRINIFGTDVLTDKRISGKDRLELSQIGLNALSSVVMTPYGKENPSIIACSGVVMRLGLTMI